MEYILRFWAKDKKNFIELKDGLKSVETRAATERYRRIKKGDILVITRGKARIEKSVKRVRLFKSVSAMFKVIPYRKINPSAPTVTAAKKVYLGYPGYAEKLKKYGVIAWNI